MDCLAVTLKFGGRISWVGKQMSDEILLGEGEIELVFLSRGTIVPGRSPQLVSGDKLGHPGQLMRGSVRLVEQ